MRLIPPHSAMPLPASHSTARPTLSATVKRMTGMLWYEMLSELNKSGLSSDTLGAGGGDFQDMFLWNVAQNDFGKYDTSLLNATMRQVGGTGDVAPEAAPSALPDFSATVAQAMQINDAPGGTGDAAAIRATAAVSAVPETTQTAGNLTAQAKSFAKSIWPQITVAAQILGVPPVAVLAQAALETGWGTAAPGHNLFGIKAVDGENGTNRATHEVVDGVLTPQNAAFRDYASTAASISDYVGQIQSGFQTALGQGTVSGFAQALQQSGYATDTNYAAKIVNISQSPLMTQVLQAVSATPQGTGDVPTHSNKTGAS
jgi:flagellar protein FlgJ